MMCADRREELELRKHHVSFGFQSFNGGLDTDLVDCLLEDQVGEFHKTHYWETKNNWKMYCRLKGYILVNL